MTVNRVIGRMIRRALPRVVGVLLLSAIFLSAVTTGVVPSSLRFAGVMLIGYALVSRDWWRYVKHGKPTPWQIEHRGVTALYVTDPGRDRYQVATSLREHSGLDFSDAFERAGDPSRPVWDDLTTESADRLGTVLIDAGASVIVKPRPSPVWARDVTGR